MDKKVKILRRPGEQGAAILESLICICILMFLLAGFVQLFVWCAQQLNAEYASFIATRARTFGFAPFLVRRNARLAAIGMSGKDLSTYPFPPKNLSREGWRQWGNDYLVRDKWGIYGVEFEYWQERTSGAPALAIDLQGAGTADKPQTGTTVTLYRSPALLPAIGKLLGYEEKGVNISGSATAYDHSHLYLEDGNDIDAE